MPQPPRERAPDTSSVRVPVAVLLPPALDKSRCRPAATVPSVDVYGLTMSTAGRLLSVYTRHGDMVIHTDASVAVASATKWLGRRSRRAFNLAAATTARPAAMLITRLPRPSAADVWTIAEWLRHSRRHLVRDGRLVAAVHTNDGHGRWEDHATTVITAARTVGLAYRQHLVTVHTPLHEAGQPSAVIRFPPGGRHLRLHTDLYVFQPHGGNDDA